MTDDPATPASTTSLDEPDSERRGLWDRVRARPVLSGALATVAIAGLAVVLLWFQPQTLLFDTVVDEDFPVVTTPPPEDGEPDSAAATDDAATDEPSDDADPSAANEPVDDAETVPDVDDGDADGVGDGDGDGDAAPVDDGEAEATAEPAAPVALASGSFTSLNRYTVTGEATAFELEDGSRILRLEDFESTNGPDLYVYLSAADSMDGDTALDDDVIDLGVLSGNIGNQNYDIPDGVDLDHYDTVVIWCLRFTTAFGASDLTPSM